jgi:hypothetical protein
MIALADESSTPPGLAQLERLGDAPMTVKVLSRCRSNAWTECRTVGQESQYGGPPGAAQMEGGRPVKLFRVAEGNRDLWVAALISDRMYVYVDNTGCSTRTPRCRRITWRTRGRSMSRLGSARPRS